MIRHFCSNASSGAQGYQLMVLQLHVKQINLMSEKPAGVGNSETDDSGKPNRRRRV